MKPYLLCPTCSSDDIMKNGTTRRGKQNYKCRECGRQFVENPQWKPKDKNTCALIDLGAIWNFIHDYNRKIREKLQWEQVGSFSSSFT